MRRLTIILLVIIANIFAVHAEQFCDPLAAREYCDTTALQRIEGIWEMTTKDCTVLISREPSRRNHYNMTVISTNDARILPGTIIGSLEYSANPDQFLLSMKGGMNMTIKCLASLQEDDMVLQIEKPKHKLKFSPSMLLSRFWRLFKYETDNPSDRLKNGLIRIYPNGVNHVGNDFRIRYF